MKPLGIDDVKRVDALILSINDSKSALLRVAHELDDLYIKGDSGWLYRIIGELEDWQRVSAARNAKRMEEAKSG